MLYGHIRWPEIHLHAVVPPSSAFLIARRVICTANSERGDAAAMQNIHWAAIKGPWILSPFSKTGFSWEGQRKWQCRKDADPQHTAGAWPELSCSPYRSRLHVSTFTSWDVEFLTHFLQIQFFDCKPNFHHWNQTRESHQSTKNLYGRRMDEEYIRL